MAKTKSKSSSTVRFGAQEPTYRISPEYDTTELRAVKLLKAGGLLLDPWQSDILDDWMAMNPGTKWICKTCGGSIPRQNGKTLIMQGRAEAGMLLYGERVLYTSHLQKTSTETFEEMASDSLSRRFFSLFNLSSIKYLHLVKNYSCVYFIL